MGIFDSIIKKAEMFKIEEVYNNYTWKTEETVIRRGFAAVSEATNVEDIFNQHSKQLVTISPGLRIGNSSIEAIIEDLHEILSPSVASIRLQSGFVSYIHRFSCRQSNLNTRSLSLKKRSVDVIMFHPNNGKPVTSYPEVKNNDINRLLSVMKDFLTQRGLLLTSFSLNMILCDEKESMKLDSKLQKALTNILCGLPGADIKMLPNSADPSRFIARPPKIAPKYLFPRNTTVPLRIIPTYQTRTSYLLVRSLAEQFRIRSERFHQKALFKTIQNSEKQCVEAILRSINRIQLHLRWPLDTVKLKFIDLKLKGPIVHSIRVVLENLQPNTQVRFDFHWNGCNSELLYNHNILVEMLYQIPTLVQLSIDYAEGRFDDDCLDSLAKFLETAIILTHLSLDMKGTNFTQVGFAALANKIHNLQELTHLHLDFSFFSLSPRGKLLMRSLPRIQDLGVAHLMRALSYLKKLVEIKLGFDLCGALSDQSLASVAECIDCLPKLSRIKFTISSPKISNVGLVRLSESLSRIRQSVAIELKFGLSQLINDEAGARIFTTLNSLSTVNKMALEFVQCPRITDQTINNASLIQEQLKKLKLNFSGTAITDSGFTTFAKGLSCMKLLMSFKLYACETHITKIGVQKLADSLAGIPVLSKLLLNFER
eukprot:TRINITY_DN2706_c0_g4_i2.p1 TRINITY_DN2706_c0_g4~~TRINITY_DN2706_c0_g4_i2.p1  ORF type:complete len:654 (-),score=19.67 TRINITY_DN2706_c0_g4_i2:261-2222(-)